MKKILLLLVSFFIFLSITACSNSNSPMSTSNNVATFNNFDDLLKWCYEDSRKVRDELGSNGGLDPMDYTLPYYPDNDYRYNNMLNFYKFSKTPIYKDDKITIYPFRLHPSSGNSDLYGELNYCDFKVFSDGRYLTTIYIDCDVEILHEDGTITSLTTYNLGDLVSSDKSVLKYAFRSPFVLRALGYNEEYSALFNEKSIEIKKEENDNYNQNHSTPISTSQLIESFNNFFIESASSGASAIMMLYEEEISSIHYFKSKNSDDKLIVVAHNIPMSEEIEYYAFNNPKFISYTDISFDDWTFIDGLDDLYNDYDEVSSVDELFEE